MEAIYEAFPGGVGVGSAVERVTLIPGSGGVFNVWRDGELIYSKHETGRHADPAEVIAKLKNG